MDSKHLDALARSLSVEASRRRLLRTLATGTLTVVGRRPLLETAAKRKRRKKTPLKRNEYGCVPLGKACRGKDNVCCSGICKGEKPKKGQRDRGECVAHDTGGCQKGQRSASCGGTNLPCTTSLGFAGFCETTTGNAGFCRDFGSCSSCRKDADCQASLANPRAACVRCTGCAEGTGCFGV